MRRRLGPARIAMLGVAIAVGATAAGVFVTTPNTAPPAPAPRETPSLAGAQVPPAARAGGDTPRVPGKATDGSHVTARAPEPGPAPAPSPAPEPAPSPAPEPAPAPAPSPAPSPPPEPAAGFASAAGPLPPEVRAAMTGVSWHPGCPVGLDDLTLLELAHWDFAGQVRTGRLVVASHAADAVGSAFARLFEQGFPIARMEPVEAYGGDDDRSMAANNTHAFNCRPVEGTDRWSEHALGTAIDINPVQNPYVREGRVSPDSGREYLDRGDVRPGMITRPGPVVDAFAAIGWRWGGDWRSVQDYHHFSASGR